MKILVYKQLDYDGNIAFNNDAEIILYSVLLEIFVAVKFGNKEIDYMTDVELSKHIANADLLLKGMDYEYERIDFEKEWLTAMVEMSVMY